MLCVDVVSPPRPSTLFPYTTLFRSLAFFGLAVVTMDVLGGVIAIGVMLRGGAVRNLLALTGGYTVIVVAMTPRSEEHTSELQSRFDLVCRPLLEKKKIAIQEHFLCL